jgi:hypothetical protein
MRSAIISPAPLQVFGVAEEKTRSFFFYDQHLFTQVLGIADLSNVSSNGPQDNLRELAQGLRVK